MTKTLSDFISEARARIRELSAEELQDMREEGDEHVLIDVRETYEYEKGHIPGSVLIPRGMLEGAAEPNNKHRIEALYSARDKTVVLCCDSGSRSALATDTLQEMGFKHVRNLAGGMKMWEAEDYEVEQGAYQGPLP